MTEKRRERQKGGDRIKNHSTRYGKCYYCVCTVCSKHKCPFRHRMLRECENCTIGRFECDYFTHYLKTRFYRFKRVSHVSEHFGTYVLITNDSVFVGKWEKLYKLSCRLGGTPKKLNIIEWWLEKK